MKNQLLTSLLLLTFYAESEAKACPFAKTIADKKKQKATGNSVTTLSEEEYNKALASDVAVIMISADFCGYCKSMKPIFDAVAQDLVNKSANFYLLSLGTSFEGSQKSALIQRIEKEHNLSISVIPHFLVFKKGELVKERCIGSQTQEQLTEFIKKQLLQ